MQPGDEIRGPAVVEEDGSTLVIGPGGTGTGGGDRQHRGDAAVSAKLDAVTLEVLWTRLISVVDEAAKAIVRTSFSTLSNEANDFACVLTDARGYALAQNSGSIPSFIGTLPATVRHFLREMGAERMRPGDVLITNDAWMGTGHMSDVSRAQADLPPRRAGGLLGDDLAHAGHRRAHPRHRGARDLRGGPAHPARQARARGPAATRR